MELRHLRYFVTAAELEHYGQAARRLGIVQPALSKQIRELEEEVGASLFSREGRGVRLTSAGKVFLEDAQEILARIPASIGRARRVACGQLGLFRAGFVDTAIYAPALPVLFNRFRAAHPGVRLELRQATSIEQAELLRRGELDMAFVYHLPQTPSGLRNRLLFKDSISLAAPTTHPLARCRRVKLPELRDEDFIWIPKSLSPPYHDLVFSACARHGFQPRIVQEGHNDNAILGLVAAGAGLSFVLESTRYRQPRGLSIIPLPELGDSLKLHAVWSEENPNPALPGMLDLIREPK